MSVKLFYGHLRSFTMQKYNDKNKENPENKSIFPGFPIIFLITKITNWFTEYYKKIKLEIFFY